MAVSPNANGLELATWQERTFQNPWLFNQVYGTGVLTHGAAPLNQIERDQAGQDWADAWNIFVRELGFSPYPVWIREEVKLPYMADLDGTHVELALGYLRAIGKRVIANVVDDRPVVYTDSGGLGIDDTATITAVTGEAADDLGVFFRSDDGAPDDGDSEWQILPLTVTSDGATATAVGHRSLFARPDDIWSKPYTGATLTRNYAETANASDFVTAVDVYTVKTSPTGAVTLIGDNDGTQELTAVSATIVDPTRGVIALSGADGYTAVPHTLEIYYQAGLSLQNGKVDPQLASAIARLAMCQAPRRASQHEEQYFHLWESNREVLQNLTREDLENVFGVMVGQVEAWRIAQKRKIKCKQSAAATWERLY